MNQNPKITLNTPQKQSVKGILVLFMYQFQDILRQAWIPILLLIYKVNFRENPIYILVILGIILLIFFFAYLKFINFTFYIDAQQNEFVIQEGIFNKSKLSIPLNKIQQVNINQTFIQKIVDVYTLEIETAGSSEKEVKIKALDLPLANYFKEQLIAVSPEKSIGIAPEETVVFKSDFITLLKVAITSHYGKSIAILLGFIGTLYNSFNDISKNFELETQSIEEQSEQIIVNSVGFLVIASFIIILIINLVTTIAKYYNFTIESNKEKLAISFGLFSKKNKILNPKKVQDFVYSQNYFQKKFDFFNLKIKQASNGTENKETIDSQIVVPGCNSNELIEIMKLIFEKSPNFDLISTPKKQYFIAVFVNYLVAPIGLFYIIGICLYPTLLSYFGFVILYVLIILIYNYFKYKNSKLHFDGDFIIKKWGAWDVSHQIIHAYKLQGITMNQKIWHQKKDVGDVVFHTASGSFGFRFGQFSILEKYVNYWLYQVESSKKKWM